MKKVLWIKYVQLFFTRHLWLFFIAGLIFFQLAQRQPFQVELARLGNQQHFEGELARRLSEGKEIRRFDLLRVINYYIELSKILPGQAYAYGNTGYCYAQLNNFSKAIKFYDKAIQINPYIYSCYWDQGMIFFERKEYERAILSFQAAIRIMPQTLVYYQNLAKKAGVADVKTMLGRYLMIAASQAEEDRFIAQLQVARSRFYLDQLQGSSLGELSAQERAKLKEFIPTMEEKYQDKLDVKKSVHLDLMFGPYLARGLLFLRLEAEKKR